MRSVLRSLQVVLALALLGAAVLVVSGRVRVEPVVTGSMAPAHPTGSLVLVTRADPGSLREGDVVMLVPPPPYRTPTGGPVMHRVTQVLMSRDGHVLLRTKGDANAAADPWTVDASAGGVMRLQASSVFAGRAVALLRSTTTWPAVLVWPGLLALVVASRSRPARPAYRPRHAA